jgi:hypothetical protein
MSKSRFTVFVAVNAELLAVELSARAAAGPLAEECHEGAITKAPTAANKVKIRNAFTQGGL